MLRVHAHLREHRLDLMGQASAADRDLVGEHVPAPKLFDICAVQFPFVVAVRRQNGEIDELSDRGLGAPEIDGGLMRVGLVRARERGLPRADSEKRLEIRRIGDAHGLGERGA